MSGFQAAFLACLLAAGPAAAQCRLALTLALDVSSSVDPREYTLQTEGVARALETADVRSAFFQVPGATVALQVFEWSGVYDQTIIVDWIAIATPEDLDKVSATIRAHRRSFENAATGLGRALIFGLNQLDRAPPDCGAQKIDVSGDGMSNVGLPPQLLYQRLDFGDVVVNGLAILSDEPNLDDYYARYVIRGPGAFVEPADGFSDFARAIRKKLVRELGVPQLGAVSTETPNPG